MICPSSILAHLAKFFVTVACIRTFSNKYDKTSTWSFHAFQILLSHSILGLLRFGPPKSTSYMLVGVMQRISWSSIFYISNQCSKVFKNLLQLVLYDR
ncbi:uncharacterized protein LOC100742148 isoform X2 [Bombus impatiens]|uniref:Uncharacterized protein LOC100742148 isoform X2 n=1 Tax=Bombus impatiens TaxID=132113 RepID=A0A6P6FD81_BOMIM|nr:uncharacterized protein LOC100742148 isoform X2 [Bombus impatiens]